MGIEGESRMKIDIIIVGAGVAGSALAYALGKDGRRVHVIERDLTEPNRLSGELLQPGGYLKLMELGLQDCVNGIDAQKFYGFVFFKDGKDVKLTYPIENLHPEVAGRSFHNGRFVQKMREKAASLTNVRLEQGSVTMLIEENGSVKGVHYKTKEGQLLQAYAPLTIVCDGIFSNLRRTFCSAKVEVPSYFVGMVLDKFEFPYPDYGNFVLAQPSSILVYPLSSTEIRCTIDVPSHKLPSISNGEMSRYLKTVVAPQIPAGLYDAFMLGVNKGSFDTMGSKIMAASPRQTPGALILGDAINMRHPITGGGMTVALSDVVVLRDLLRSLGDLNDAKSVSISLKSFYTLRKSTAFPINTMAAMVHKVFSEQANEPLRKEIPRLCFDYMRLQGNGTNGLISFTSGLNPHPTRLFYHFFAIAVYGVGRLLLPFPSPIRAARFIQEALSIIIPILKAEGVRHMLFPITMPSLFRVMVQRIIGLPKKIQ